MTDRKKNLLKWLIPVCVAVSIPLICLALVLAIVLGYVGYVLIAYYRIGDMDLAVTDGTAETLTVGETYTALSWNIGFGAYSDDYSFFMDGGEYSRAFSEAAVYENADGFLQILKQYDTTFRLLQEVDNGSTRTWGVDLYAYLDDKLKGTVTPYDATYCLNYDSPYLFYPLTSPHGKSRSGLFTMSHANMTASKRVELPIENSFMKFLDLDRCYNKMRISVEGGKYLCLYNVHLSAYTSDGTIAEEQLEKLLADMRRESDGGNWCIAGGDFNKDLLGDSATHFDVPPLESNWAQPFPEHMLPEGYALHGARNLPTCRNADTPYTPGETFVLTVDGFIVSPNVSVTSVVTIDEQFAHSDHNPTILTFALN